MSFTPALSRHGSLRSFGNGVPVLIEVPRVDPGLVRRVRAVRRRRRLRREIRWGCYVLALALLAGGFRTIWPGGSLGRPLPSSAGADVPEHGSAAVSGPRAVILSIEPQTEPPARPAGFLLPDEPVQELADAKSQL